MENRKQSSTTHRTDQIAKAASTPSYVPGGYETRQTNQPYPQQLVGGYQRSTTSDFTTVPSAGPTDHAPDYQTPGGGAGAYVNQNWQQGIYVNYGTAATQQYSPSYNQWADYSVPGAYVASNTQQPATTVQHGAAISNVQDGYWKHGTPTFQTQNVGHVQSNVRTPLDSNHTYAVNVSGAPPKTNSEVTSHVGADTILEPSMFPESLCGYVERALSRCKDDKQIAACQEVMKKVITKATDDGVLYTRNWDMEPLFLLPSADAVNNEVKDVRMNPGFAFVEFSDSRDADDARYSLNGRDVDGSCIVVEFANKEPRGCQIPLQRTSGLFGKVSSHCARCDCVCLVTAVVAPCSHVFCKRCLAYIVSTSHACLIDGQPVTVADSAEYIG